MSPSRVTSIPVALGIGAVALVSACGSSSKPAASAAVSASAAVAAPASSAPASSAAAAASAASTAATTRDPCSLLTAAEVSTAVGGTVGEGVASAGTPPLNGKMCNWSNSDGPVIDFEVTVRTDADLSSTSQTVDDLFSETTTFPGLTSAMGIGDKAFFGKTNGYVLKRGVLLETVADIGGTADSSSINKTLTAMAVAKLP